MPLTLTLTEGVLPEEQESAAFQQLSEAMLRWHGQADNAAMRANIVGAIHRVARTHSFAGGQPADVAFVEWKVPSTLFAAREVQIGYVEEATNLLHDLSGGRHPKERIWVNVVHAVDGSWGIAGAALTNAQLAQGPA